MNLQVDQFQLCPFRPLSSMKAADPFRPMRPFHQEPGSATSRSLQTNDLGSALAQPLPPSSDFACADGRVSSEERYLQPRFQTSGDAEPLSTVSIDMRPSRGQGFVLQRPEIVYSLAPRGLV
jgi:hypothetical protein